MVTSFARNWFKSILLCLMTAVAAPGISAAHEIDPAIADVAVGRDQVQIDVQMSLESILLEIDLATYSDTADAPEAQIYDSYRAMDPAQLAEVLQQDWDGMADRFVIETGGVRVTPALVGADIPPIGDLSLARTSTLHLTATLPEGDAPVRFGWVPLYGDLVVRQVGGGEDAYAGFLSDGALSDPLPRGAIATEGWGAVFARYIVVGVEHIVPLGTDHILFVLGLFFFALHVRPLLFQVTSFTVAHTVSLALASLGIVTVPSSVVEPLIALSIVFVALENVFGIGTIRSRTALVFGFGLLHGLGFASVLGDIGIDPTRFVTALIGFNIGVEIGQLIVLTGAFLLVGLWFGRKEWYRARISVPASAIIAAIGLWWSFERVFL